MWVKLIRRKYFIFRRISYQWYKQFILAWFNLLYFCVGSDRPMSHPYLEHFLIALVHDGTTLSVRTQWAHTVSIVSLHALSVRMRQRRFWCSLGELELCMTHRNVYTREYGDWSYFSCIWAFERVQQSCICNAWNVLYVIYRK